MHIGLVVDWYEPHISGVPVSINTYADYLQENGHEVTIFAPKITGYIDDDRYRVVRIPSFGYGIGKVAFPWLTRQIVSLAASLKLDIIHIQGPYFTGFWGIKLARRLRIPVGLTYHTDIIQSSLLLLGNKKWLLGFWVKLIAYLAVARCFNSCSFIIAPTQYVKQRIELYNKKLLKKVLVCPTAIKIPDLDLTKAQARQALGIEQDIPLVLFVGRLSKEKETDLLLDAFEWVASRHTSAQLVFVGPGYYKKHLLKRAKSKNLAKRVHFTNGMKRRRVDIWYAACDLLALTSQIETQALVIPEAWALGKPVVAVARGGPAEFVINGRHGFACEPNIQAVGQAILFLLSHPDEAQKYGSCCLKDVEKLAPSVIYPPLIEICEKLLTK